MDIQFKCYKCGKCCHEIQEKEPGIYKRIPLYPNEADRLEKIAEERNIPLKLIEDLVFPDVKNKKILVLTWRIILEDKGVCPFYDPRKGCSIHDKKPLACLAYPLAIKRIDAFNMKIDIDPLCKYTEMNRNDLENVNFDELQQIYPEEYDWAKKMLQKNQKVIMKIRALEYTKKIQIPRKISPEDYNDFLLNWEREVIK